MTDKLQADGITSFADAFNSMLNNIAAKKLNMLNEKSFAVHLGNSPNSVKENFKKLTDANIAPRIWEKDHTVWRDNPNEISNRLGWLESPRTMKSKIVEIEKIRGYN